MNNQFSRLCHPKENGRETMFNNRKRVEIRSYSKKCIRTRETDLFLNLTFEIYPQEELFVP